MFNRLIKIKKLVLMYERIKDITTSPLSTKNKNIFLIMPLPLLAVILKVNCVYPVIN